MTGFNRGLLLTAAATMVFAVGCGDTSSTDAGNGCSTDANCGTGKVCHPVLKECISSCTGASDCPASEKKCATFAGATATSAAPGFCQCETDAICGMGVAGNICSTATKQCTAKCSATSCPSGYTCNTTSGQCAGGATTDGGTDAGVDAGVDAGMTVDAGLTCNSTQLQPSTCPNGDYCSVINTCENTPMPTCGNFPAASPPLTWTAASTGPVIFALSQVLALNTNATFCGATNPVRGKVLVRAYDQGGRLDSETMQPSFSYYRTNGTAIALDATSIQNYATQASGNYAEFEVNFCAPTGTTSLTVGLSFANGNGACFTIN